MKTSIRLSHLFFLISVLCSLISEVAAQAPQLINYQGRLLNGTNLVNDTVGLSLRLFNAPSGGSPQYEDSNSVAVVDGLYSTFLGDQTNSGNFANALTNAGVWVEIAVNGSALTPRERVASVTYALLADGVKPGGVTAAMIASGAVSTGSLDLASLDARYVNATGDTINGNLNIGGFIDATNFGGNKLTFYYDNFAALPSPAIYHGMFAHTHDAGGKAYYSNGGGWVLLAHDADVHDAANITAGTLNNARLSASVSLLGQTISSAEIDDSTITAADVAANTFWETDGNAGTTATTHFAGTTDNQPFEIRTLNQRVARFDTATNAANVLIPNVILGHSANLASNGTAFGSVIGGGGNNGNPQIVGAAYDTIAGGVGNRATGGDSTVAGGRRNVANGLQSFVGGGFGNFAAANNAVIGGGTNNTIAAASPFSVIAGGLNNDISNNTFAAAIGGGENNNIHSNSTYSFIGGGTGNDVLELSQDDVIGGGVNNNIGALSHFSFIGGGALNDVFANNQYDTIGGGRDNNIGTNAQFASILGGAANQIRTLSYYATIGGGTNNTISESANSATIAGGEGNTIDAAATHAVIGGGYFNRAGGIASTVPGGQNNEAANTLSFAAGNRAKAAHVGSFVWGDASDEDIVSTNDNSVTMRAVGGYRLFTDTNNLSGAELPPGGGSWIALSDRNAKENYETVDTREILEKVAALSITKWNYKSQVDSIRHIGPVAQDFHDAFGVGEKPTGITGVDADGVALAAIQELIRQNRALQARVSEVEKRLEMSE